MSSVLGFAQNSSNIMALPSSKGVYIRLSASYLENKIIGKSQYVVKRRKLDETNFKTVGEMQVVKNYTDFQRLVGIKEAAEFDKMKAFSSPTQTMSFFNSNPSYQGQGLDIFSELKVEFLQAIGFAFLDNSAQKQEIYRYAVFEVKGDKTESLIEEISVFNNPKNFFLDDVDMRLQRIVGGDSSVSFEWKVSLPAPNSIEQTPIPNQTDNASYNQLKANCLQNQQTISLYSLNAFTTRFAAYFRINDDANWKLAERMLAYADSTGQLRVSLSIKGKFEDLVEVKLIPEDYVYNVGRPSNIARGVIVHKGNVELIYGVNARDTTNANVLTWQKLSNKPYYSGIEISRSTGGADLRKVVQILPVTADTYTDTDIFPAGQMLHYFVRPIFIPFQDLEQDVPASTAITCSKFSRPTPPFNVTITPEGPFARIKWEVADEKAAHSFYIFRGTSPKKMLPIRSAVVGNNYLDTTGYLSPRITYYYSVMAVNLTQDTSDYSPYVSFVPHKQDSDLQSPPLISFEIINDKAVLGWADVKLNDDYIVGYALQRKKVNDKTFQNLTKEPITGETYTDESFERGVEYLYRIASITVRGDTATFSPNISISAAKEKVRLNGIENIKLSNLSKTIRVAWPPIESSNIVKYKVYRKLPTDANFKLLSTLPSGTFEFEDRNIKNNTIYVYTVTALDKDNNESEIVEKKSVSRESAK